MKEIVIQIKGMSCAHCEKRVSRALSAIRGVEACTVSAAEGSAVVRFDETLADAEALKTAVREAGYEVV